MYFLVKNMGTAKGYMFRVFSHSATSFTPSDEYKYPMPPNIKKRAITAGLIGNIYIFLYSNLNYVNFYFKLRTIIRIKIIFKP